MGGREAIRGFAIQTLICLLDALKTDDDWIAVTIEPDSDNDKVDILWDYADRKKFVQVKSSKNSIGKADVEGWAGDLLNSGKADAYEIRLAGPVAAGVFNTNDFGGVHVPTPSSIGLLDLTEQAVTKLDKYLSRKDIDPIPVSVREELVNICAARLLEGSAAGEKLTRETFDGWLLHWITASYPQALSTRLAAHCEVLWGSFDLLPPEQGSQAYKLGVPLTVYNAGRGAAIIEWFVIMVRSGTRHMIYAPSTVESAGGSQPFSKFVVGPNQSLDRRLLMTVRSRPGFDTDAWPLGSHELELFVKFSAAESAWSVAKAPVQVTGDHVALRGGSGVRSFPVSNLEEYLDTL